MKIYMMNGWRDAPHYWKRYLLRPVRIERRSDGCVLIEIVGLAFFICGGA